MFDRYWRLRVIGAAASLAGAAAFAAWYVVYVLPIDLRAGKLAFTGIMAAIDVVFVLSGIAAYQLIKAAPQRRRSALRREVMNGNRDAIPLARPLPSAASNAEANQEPFDVRFVTAFQQWRAITIRVIIALGIVALGVGGVVQNLAGSRLSAAFMCPQGQEQHCAGELAVFMLLSLLFAVPCFLGGLSLIVEMFRTLSVTPLRVNVREEGLVRHAFMRRSVLIPWSEIRLLEVWHSAAKQGARWVRYRHFMCFTHSYQFGWAYEEQSAISEPFARLTAAVMEHTGLLARTFDADLFETSTVPRFNWSERASGRIEVVLAGVALMIGIVAFLPVLPPQAQSNDQTALIIIAVGLIFFVLMSFKPPKLSLREQGGVALVSAESLDDARLVIHPAATYEMTVGSYPLFRANQVLFGMLGLISTVAGAAILVNEFDPALLTNHGTPLVPATPISIAIAVGVMAVGLATIVGAARARDTIVVADTLGVRKRWLLGNVFIPWERVERIERARYWGAPGYRVVSSQPKVTIQWPIEPFQPSRKPQEPSAILTTPAQMAEVVAQRSGRPIREVGR